MKLAVLFATVICLLAFVTTAPPCLAQAAGSLPNQGNPGSLTREAPGSETQDLALLLQQLLAEMTKLRSELLEERLGNLAEQRAQWERELERVRNEQRGVQEQERALTQEIAAVDRRLGQALPDDGDRAELEATRKRLTENKLGRLQTELQKISLRETEVMKQLTELEQRQQQTLARIKTLKVGASQNAERGKERTRGSR